MFEQFNSLLANSQKLVLTIEKQGNELVVVTNAIINNSDTEQACELREALSKPLTFKASPQELNNSYAGSLASYVMSFQQSSNNLADIQATIEQSAASTPTPTANVQVKIKAAEPQTSAPEINSDGSLDSL